MKWTHWLSGNDYGVASLSKRYRKCSQNKNDTIHKKEAQEIRWSDNNDKLRVAANIIEYHVILKLIFLRISNYLMQKLMKNVKVNMLKWTYGLLGQN